MILPNLFRNISIVLICCLLALSSHSFPKKKHSIIKEKLDREAYQNIYEYGYYFGFLQYCSFPGKNINKNFYKRIKGLVAYTNWDLFLIFNNGIQKVEGDLQIAGIGWAGTSWSAHGWQSKPIDWGFDLKDCGDEKSWKKAYAGMESVAKNAILEFLLERDNYQSNLNALLLALQEDRRDDYGSVIQKLKSSSETYGTSGVTIATDNSTTEETSTINVSIDNNSSGESKSIRSQLKELKSLFEDELISEDDYNTKKQQLLDLL